jgi:hypothetical protein
MKYMKQALISKERLFHVRNSQVNSTIQAISSILACCIQGYDSILLLCILEYDDWY